ncbi:aspartyl protease family protein At5g10770-like [Prosopis cineraria]|uniref:aspartyl protease family protein At5g10770-like n=1 Tax=Prosopis cineraria TaxID=364024 RepID=UPI00240FA323|nr:aspartyl protease family protein At5g10770-like [Prosopis cineraria]
MASSSSNNPFLIASFSLVCFFFFVFSPSISKNKSLVSAKREEASELQNTYHRIPLSSLFPSSSCSSPPQGGSKNGSMEVVHKHGPCSKLKQPSSSSSSSSLVIPHSKILKQDEARVRAINNMLSKIKNHCQEAETSMTQVPARSGIPLGSENYYVTVRLGTPERDLSLEFDTGSDLTWTQCKPCAGSCYSQKDPIFDPSQSSSYFNVPCNSSLCSHLSSSCYSPTRACFYGIRYGDGSFTIGSYAKETLTISPNDVFQNFLFGCC